MTTIGLLKDTDVDSEHPGQVFVNAFGEGGATADLSEEGRELVKERESFSQWFLVHRPPLNSTFGDTEVIIQRLGPDDVIVCQTKNRDVESEAKTKMGADPVPGDVALFTGDGTNTVCIHMKPGGDVAITTSGDISLDPTGEVLIGGAAATDYVTLFTALKTEYDLHVHTCPPPLGNTGVPTVPLTTTPRSTKGRAI